MLADEFNKIFGEKPVFAGVYTDKPIDVMVKEAEQFAEAGFHIYIESLRYRLDRDFLKADETKIQRLLDLLAKSSSFNGSDARHIGINFSLKPDIAYEIAKERGLFVANDSFSGNYRPFDGLCDPRHEVLDIQPFETPGVVLFAGISPGYLINIRPHQNWEDWEKREAKLFADADAILVGNSKIRSARDQLIFYCLQSSYNKPLIAAQGVSGNNIGKLSKYADGFVIGSGLRSDGQVDPTKINAVRDLLR